MCERARDSERERERESKRERERKKERGKSFSHEKKQHRLTTFFAVEFDRKINISDQIDEFGDLV